MQRYVDFLENTAKSFEDKDNREFILVSHVFPNIVPFIDVLRKKGKIVGIISKGSKPHENAKFALQQRDIKVLDIKKEDFYQRGIISEKISPLFSNKSDKIIIDIGGYFSPVLEELQNLEGLLGIVEDTQNGFKKYEKSLENIPKNKVPIYSIARNFIKTFEDNLIGKAIAQSTLDILDKNNIEYSNYKFGVIGTGSVGRGVSNYLQNHKNLCVGTYDKDRFIRKGMRFCGFLVNLKKEDILKTSDVLICATGNKSISKEDLEYIKPNCYVSSCTSFDDEFNLDKSKIEENKNYEKISKLGNINLINNGNAVNFTSVEKQSDIIYPYIYLTFAGIIKSAVEMERKGNKNLRDIIDVDMIEELREFEKITYTDEKENTKISNIFIEDMLNKNLRNNIR